MNRIIFICLCLIFVSTFSFGQNAEYTALGKIADSLYQKKDYLNAAHAYSDAFKANGWKGLIPHRYNAACCWAMAGVPDSAFFQLNRIATRVNYKEYAKVAGDPELNSLHSDARWKPLLELILHNKEKAEIFLDKHLMAQLDTIYYDDQHYRLQVDSIEQKFGRDSKEMKAHWNLIIEKDSVNLIKVENILDTRGWLGPEIVGEQGNTTLFLVIQHADIATQEKYLPMMREAVRTGKAKASSLALLEDRVALREGRKQIFGSQIGFDKKTNLYYVSPLDDPDHVDERRAQVGLQPLADYVATWGMTWDVEQYKKDLPKYEEWQKAKQ